MSTVDPVLFARKVERLTGFLIEKFVAENGRHAQEDLVALEKLRDEAADISTGKVRVMESTLEGLAEVLR